jgi:Uma2 family endonuclease
MEFENISGFQYDTSTSIDVYERLSEPEIEKSMASKNHAKIQSRLARLLGNQYEENYDVYTEYELELVGKKVVPDVCLLPIEDSNWLKDVIRGTDVPNLIIEILSPRQAFTDITEKIVDTYIPAGATSVWVILPPAMSLMIFTPQGKPQTYNTGIIKDSYSGFEIDLDKVFK